MPVTTTITNHVVVCAAKTQVDNKNIMDKKPGMGEIETARRFFIIFASFKSYTAPVWTSPFKLKMNEITRAE